MCSWDHFAILFECFYLIYLNKSKTSCTLFTALSKSVSLIKQVILISDVVIISIFTLDSNKASKNLAA